MKCLLFILIFLLSSKGFTQTFTVTNSNPTGAGSLSQAIAGVNSSADTSNTVNFNSNLANINLPSNTVLQKNAVFTVVGSNQQVITTENFQISSAALSFDGNFNFSLPTNPSGSQIFLGSGSINLDNYTNPDGTQLTLFGTNSYSGGTFTNIIDIGRVNQINVQQNDCLGVGDLTINGSTLLSMELNNNITLNNQININIDSLAFDIPDGCTLTLNGVINGSGKNGIELNDTGTLILNNNSNSIAGIAFYSDTVLSISEAGALGTGYIDFIHGGTLKLTPTAPINISNVIYAVDAPVQVEVDGTQVATFSGYIGQMFNQTPVVFNKTGSGTLNFNSNQSYISSLNATGGTIQISQNFLTTPPITLTNTNFQTSLNLTLPQAIACSGNIGFIADSSTNLNLNGVISGTANLTFPGPGVVNLNSTNTFVGSVNITGGTVTLANNCIPSTSSITMSGSSTLNILQDLTIKALNSTDPTPEIKIGGILGCQIVADCEYDGVISSGNLNLNASSPNVSLTLTNPLNSYSGITTIGNGIIKITSANLGSSTVQMTSGILEVLNTCSLSNLIQLYSNDSQINVDTGQTLTLTGQVQSVNGINLFLNGPGTLLMNNTSLNSNSISSIKFNQGTYAVSNQNDMPLSSLIANGGNTLRCLNTITAATTSITLSQPLIIDVPSGSSTFSLNSNISGSSGFTKIGSGTLTLNGTSSFTGSLVQSAGTINLLGTLATNSININGGTFNLNSSNYSFAAGAVINMANGTFLSINGSNNTIPALNMTGSSSLNVNSTDTTINSLNGPTGSTINFGNSSGTFINIGSGTFNGKITGEGWFNVLAPSNTVTITNPSNDFNQGINIIDGTLRIPAATLGNQSSVGQSITFFYRQGTSPKLEAYGTTPFTLINNIELQTTGVFIVDQGQTLTLNGMIQDQLSSSLDKYGPGILVLNNSSNNNNYTGINLNSGTLSVGYSTDLNNNITFSGNSTLEVFKTVTASGNIVMNSSGTILTDDDVTLTCSGVLSGSGNITKTGGGGYLILTGSSGSFAGGLTFNEGTIQVSSQNNLGSGQLKFTGGNLNLSGNSFTINNNILLSENLGSIYAYPNNTYTLSGIISGNLNVPFFITGPGILALSGQNTYSGGTVIYKGSSLQFDSGTKLGSGPVTFSSSGSGSNGTIIIQDGLTGLSFTSPINLASNGTFQIGSSNQNTNLSINSVISGPGGLTVAGAGTLNLSASNTYTGGTTIGGSSTLYISSVSSLGVPLSTGINFIGTNPKLKLPVGGINFSYPLSISSPNVTIDLNIGSTVISGAILSSVQGSNLTITATGGPANVTLSGSNQIGGLTLYTQGTNQVTLIAASQSNLYNDQIVFTSTASTYSVLEATNSFSSINPIVLNSSGNISVDAGKTLTLDGQITGSGGLIFNSIANLVLTNSSNSYSGGTTVTSGILKITTPSLGSGAVTISAGTLECVNSCSLSNQISIVANGIINVDNGQTLTLQGQLTTGQNSLTLNGSGTLFMNNSSNNNSINSIQFNSGICVISNSNDVPTGAVVANGGNTLRFLQPITSTSNSVKLNPLSLMQPLNIDVVDGSITINSASTISGSSGFTKIGNGSLTLNGTNSFTGPLVQSAGTISLGSALASTAVNINNGTFNLNQNGSFASATNITMAGSSILNINVNSTTGYLNSQSTNTTVNLASGKTLTINGGNCSYSGLINGDGVLTYAPVSGLGTFILTNPLNSYTGGTNIGSGFDNNSIILQITAPSLGQGPVNMAGGTLKCSNNVSLDNQFSTTAISSIYVDSGLTLTLNGQVNVSQSDSLSLNGPGTLLMNNSLNNDSIRSIQFNNGTYAVSYSSDVEANIYVNGGNTLKFLNSLESANTSIALYQSLNIEVVNGKTAEFQNGSNIQSIGNYGLTKIGNGSLTLNGTNSFTGPLVQSAGTINLGSALAATVVNINDGTFNLNQNGSFASATNITMAGSSILNVNVNSTAGYLNSQSTNTTVNLASGKTLTINGGNCSYLGLINGAGSLDYGPVSGVGTFVLTNPLNSYTGGTNIGTSNYSSILQITAPSLGQGPVTMAGGTLKCSNNVSLDNQFSTTASSAIYVDSGLTLILNGQVNVSQGDSLSLNGSGTLLMNNSSNNNSISSIQFNNGIYAASYSSDVEANIYVNGGNTLKFLNSLQSSSTKISLNQSFNIEVATGKTVTLQGSSFITSSAPSTGFTKTGAGTLILDSNNQYNGQVTVQQGVLNFQSDPAAVDIDLLGGVGVSALIFSQSSDFVWGNKITGSGAFYKEGSAQLTVNQNQTYEGPLYLNEGILILNGGDFSNVTITEIAQGATIIADTSVVISQPDGEGEINNQGFGIELFCETSSLFSGDMVGSGNITKTGSGSIEVTSNWTETRNIFNSQGEFIANNTIANADVDNYAVWKGNNTVLNFINENGGIQKPGNSIGTQVILGNYTANSGSTLEIEYDQFGNVDLVQVGGAATINPGSTLKIIALPGYEYTRGEKYTFLTSDTSVTGQYSNLIISNQGDALLHPVSIIYDPKSISFVLGIAPITVKDTYLIPFTSQLSNQVIAGQMDTLSTHLYMNLLTNIAAHPDDPCGKETNVRMKGFAIYNSRNGGFANNGLNFANQFFINSGLFGVQFNNQNNFIGGLGGGYAYGRTIGSRDEGAVFSSTVDLFAYFQSACIYKFVFDGFLMQNFSSYQIKRNSPTDLKAVGNFNGLQTGLQLRALYEASMRFFNFIPYFAARYEYLSTTKYKEKKAREDSNQISADHQNLLFTDLGFNICIPLYIKQNKIMPQFGFSYIHQFFTNDRYVNIKNYDDTRWTQFKVNAIDRNMIKINGGVEIVKNNSSYYANADYLYGENQYYTWDLRLGIKLSF